MKMRDKIIATVSDTGGIFFSLMGFNNATNETYEMIFLILSIISVGIAVLSRVLRGIVVLWAKWRKAKADGVITPDELQDITNEIVAISEGVKEDLKGVQDEGNTKKD